VAVVAAPSRSTATLVVIVTDPWVWYVAALAKAKAAEDACAR
jgi:hypothetical protein